MSTISLSDKFSAFVLQDSARFPKEKDLKKKIDNASRFERAATNTEVLDKVLKLAQPLMDAGQIISKAYNAPEYAKGFAGAEKFLRAARDANAMIAIFGGSWRLVLGHTVTISRLARGFFEDITNVPKHERQFPEGVPLKGRKLRDDGKAEELKFNEIAKNRKEMILAFLVEIGKLLSQITFVAAFGVCRTASNLYRQCNVKDKTAKEIGDYFGDLMFACHVGGMWSNTFDLIDLKVMRDRALKEENLKMRETPEGGETETEKSQKDAEFENKKAEKIKKIREEYEAKSWRSIINLIAKVLEVTNCILKKLEAKKVVDHLPHEATVPLGVAIGIFSLYGVWLRTP